MALQLILPPLLLLISPFSSVATASLDGMTHPVYVADNEVRWTLGYMNVLSYDPRGVGSVGMVFFFPRNGTYCFWMKNTKIPLTIVWISGEAVTAWAQGQPLNESPVCGYGDKVLELRPDVAVPRRVRIIGIMKKEVSTETLYMPIGQPLGRIYRLPVSSSHFSMASASSA